MTRKQRGRSPGRSVATARAAWAWAAVDRAVESGADTEKYANEARELPARLLASGLGQSLAYLYSKRERRTGAIYRDISRRIVAVLGRGDPDDAMGLVVSSSAAEYRRLGREIVASAEWLKRFADGRLPSETNEVVS